MSGSRFRAGVEHDFDENLDESSDNQNNTNIGSWTLRIALVGAAIAASVATGGFGLVAILGAAAFTTITAVTIGLVAGSIFASLDKILNNTVEFIGRALGWQREETVLSEESTTEPETARKEILQRFENTLQGHHDEAKSVSVSSESPITDDIDDPMPQGVDSEDSDEWEYYSRSESVSSDSSDSSNDRLQHLHELSDGELILSINEDPSIPNRLSVTDEEVGELLLRVNDRIMPADGSREGSPTTPFRNALTPDDSPEPSHDHSHSQNGPTVP